MKKSVLITGAGSGIGEATAHIFSENQYHVFLLGRNLEKLKNVHSKIPNSTIIVCDITDPDQVDKQIQPLLSNTEYDIQVLINNAGIFKRHTFEEGREELWMEQWATNMLGPVRLTRAIFPYFRQKKKGSIVNVSSTLGLKTIEGTSAYSACKAAMINWTSSLALEGAAHGIRANCVCPGIVDTPIHDFHSLPTEQKKKSLEAMGRLQPLGRVGTPDEIAYSLFFLGSDFSSWTTGAVLSVDGGINLI